MVNSGCAALFELQFGFGQAVRHLQALLLFSVVFVSC